MTRQRIQSLDRGLAILEHIASQDRPARLADLAELLGVEKSSACRLVHTLADRQYVRQEPETLGYVLDEKVFELAGKLASRRGVQQHARKYLRMLAQETGETAHLAVRGTDGAVLVDHEFGNHPLAATAQWGSSDPLHCSAVGKALLAGMDKPQLRDVFGSRRLKRHTEHTMTRLGDLAEQCARLRPGLLAFDWSELRENMNCIASPVCDFRGQVVAAIGISGPAERVTSDTAKTMGRPVGECAVKLSGELGYQP